MSFEDDFDDEPEQASPFKFQDYFAKAFTCKKGRNGEMFCKMDGEVVKIPNGVRRLEFDPDKADNIEAFVKDNHRTNKKAGITYRDEWEEGKKWE